MPAVKKDLYIEQGATFRMGFAWCRESATVPGTPGDPYDITGCVARMQIRKTQGSTALLSLTSAPGGGITLGGTTGRVDVVVTDDQTDTLTTAKALYDLEIEFPNGDVYRLLKGSVTVDPNVTQKTGDPVVS